MSIAENPTNCAAPEEESHRDRKARLTRRAIHVAAVHQVLDQGLENATVAHIAAEAGVSTRTFFNYFSSKEDAIVGFTDRTLDDEQIAEFLERPLEPEALVEDIARLIHAAFMLTFNDDEVATGRRRIFAQHPALLRRQFEKNERLEDQVTEVVASRIRQHGLEYDSQEPLEEVARMLVLVCVAPLRATARRIAQKERADLEEDYSTEIFERSVRLFLDVVKGPRK
ncbi:TetR family transcriptional regulator [Brevibacterium daeguense]|uniref:TetR family transcriptional regulator n=1 Tax=Brevibacterium daeguense TaxID=909936 RepID=A0ABP8EN29_9MICO|nr:TetR/AcrR family transcriptional regulator [Brevibacterium daeguense]